MKRRNASLMALTGLVVVSLIGSTYAYWNQTATVENPFDTGNFGGATIQEDFKPSDGEDWQPGAEINKDVIAENTGDTEIIVRVKLDEKWTRKGAAASYKENTATTGDVYTLGQANATDGLTTADQSVVEKKFSGSANWIDGGDGWYYYKTNLAAGAKTDKWLDSVVLKSDVDMGVLNTKHFVTASTAEPYTWFEYTGTMPSYIDALGAPCASTDPGAQMVLHNKVQSDPVAGQEGYSNSDYVLSVTVETVQNTQAAIDATFGGGSPFTAPAGSTWTLK